MRFLTDFADQAVMLPVIMAVTLLLAIQGWRRGALLWLGVVLATLGLILVLKLVCLGCPPVFGPADLHSPSGHVAAATIVSGGVAALLTRRGAVILSVALCAAIVVGLSRVALGMHSLPEVVLGAIVGLSGTIALVFLAGTRPALRPGRLLAVTIIVAAVFHGMHLPAEAAIRHAAQHTFRLLPVCG